MEIEEKDSENNYKLTYTTLENINKCRYLFLDTTDGLKWNASKRSKIFEKYLLEVLTDPKHIIDFKRKIYMQEMKEYFEFDIYSTDSDDSLLSDNIFEEQKNKRNIKQVEETQKKKKRKI